VAKISKYELVLKLWNEHWSEFEAIDMYHLQEIWIWGNVHLLYYPQMQQTKMFQKCHNEDYVDAMLQTSIKLKFAEWVGYHVLNWKSTQLNQKIAHSVRPHIKIICWTSEAEYHPKIWKYFNQILQEFSWFEIKKMLMLNQENITILYQVT